MSNGESYEGEWSGGVFNGFGSYQWPDQTYYSGFFKDGFKDGSGKYVTKNGQSFEGNWERGKRNGKGILWKDGKTIEGLWANDKFLRTF
jgi:hypothetical protein